MLTPRKVKHRKVFRGRSDLKGNAGRGTRISFGSFALKAQTAGEINSRQIEAARRAMTRHVKRGGKIWIRIYPHKPITAKAAEVPMGSGKGAPDRFVATIKPGTILFEMDGVDVSVAQEAMKLAAAKLPVKCKFLDVNNLI